MIELLTSIFPSKSLFSFPQTIELYIFAVLYGDEILALLEFPKESLLPAIVELYISRLEEALSIKRMAPEPALVCLILLFTMMAL